MQILEYKLLLCCYEISEVMNLEHAELKRGLRMDIVKALDANIVS